MADASENTGAETTETPGAESVAVGQTRRDPRGRFLPGNDAARTSGVRMFMDRGELPMELRPALDRFVAQVTTDQGGDAELTAIRGGYVRRLAELEGCLLLLTLDLQTRGLMTARGRVRNTYTLFLQTLDRWDKLAQRLGMGRVAKPAPTLAELIDAAGNADADAAEDDAALPDTDADAGTEADADAALEALVGS